jgi:hypothetical protein
LRASSCALSCARMDFSAAKSLMEPDMMRFLVPLHRFSHDAADCFLLLHPLDQPSRLSR